MKLSVVILNYNVRYFLELCLNSVQKALRDIDSEIIVVDNASNDESCAMVRAHFPEINLIENKENLGFSKGNNIGVEEVKGEYVCILNPDTVVTEDTFETLLEFYESKDKIGILGCQLIDGKGCFLPESKRNVPTPKIALKKLIGLGKAYYANHLEKNEIGGADIFVGAFMLLRTELYKSVGGFDEDYFMYGEDIDLSYKIKKAGFQNYYVGTQSIIHFKGESTLKDKTYAKRFFGAMQIFYRKHFKTYFVIDAFVWIGLRLAKILSRPSGEENQVTQSTYFLTNRPIEDFKDYNNTQAYTYTNVGAQIPNDTTIVYDCEFVDFKTVITDIKERSKRSKHQYRFLLGDPKFVIGSDSSKGRGEIKLA
ncbi:glycosyltransferase family 2 protein [Winogradskyella poriferorum]|uniref:glycosyltransferase family 2 protein n=1 Tax=Winogradskyella poriferorum TaxID=307627 RepID=UPI003D64E9C9